MPRISPTVLNTGLKASERHGVIAKRPVSGQRGHEYRLTPAGREIGPFIEALVVRGMRWARDELRDDEADVADVAFLMFDIERNVPGAELPDGETVRCFQFPDRKEYGRWWIVCDGDERDLCYRDPGKDLSAFVTATSRDIIGVWMGDVPLRAALDDERVVVIGDSLLRRRFSKWFTPSSAAGTPRPS